MADAILVLNAGSSSLKFSVYSADGDTLARAFAGSIEELDGPARFRATGASGEPLGERTWQAPPGHAGALAHLFDWLREHTRDAPLAGIGHRVVHGGRTYSAPVLVSEEVLRELEERVPLAPLHQPHNLAPIRAIAARWPEVPQVACFDTAFHAAMPEIAQAFALPPDVGGGAIRRYGFHGLSYEHIADTLPQHDRAAAEGRTVVLHLGNGSSMCAMVGGRSVATTMGFTAVDGLPMGTRSGSIDPGVVLYLLQELGMDADAVATLLYERSGLLGVSGLSSDMRVLLGSDAPRARFAVALYTYRIGRELGSLAAAMGGLDAMVFTAGIGENAAPIREAVCADAAWLGVALDPAAGGEGARRISARDSRVAVWVIPTDEERMIARHTRSLLARP